MIEVNYQQNTNVRNGCIAECMFKLKAMNRGWDVFSPEHHSTPADLIICKTFSTPIKIQIKKMVWQKRSKKHKSGWSCKTEATRTSSIPNKKYGEGAFDVFVGVVIEKEKFVFKSYEESQATKSFWYYEDNPTNGTGNWDLLGEIEVSKPKLYDPQKNLFELI